MPSFGKQQCPSCIRRLNVEVECDEMGNMELEGRRGAQVVIVFYFKTDFNENGLTLPRNIILKSE
jgi:hypothetical protein